MVDVIADHLPEDSTPGGPGVATRAAQSARKVNAIGDVLTVGYLAEGAIVPNTPEGREALAASDELTAKIGEQIDADAIPNTSTGRASAADSDEFAVRYAKVGPLQAQAINPVARGAVGDYTGRIGVVGTGTDSRAAIQAAIDAASDLAASDYYAYLQRRSYVVELPAGNYILTANAFGTPSIVVKAGVVFDCSRASIFTDYPSAAGGKWSAIKVEQYGNVILGKLANSKRVPAPDGRHIYDGVRVVCTDNQSRVMGYKDSEINGYQGAAVRGIASWITHVQGIRFVSCSYSYIASNVSDGGAFYGITVRSTSGSGTVTNRVHTDLFIRDCQFVNNSRGGILGVVQGTADHPNDPDYSQSGFQLYVDYSIFENIGARALQIYNAFVVKLRDVGIEEVGESGGGMMLFDTVRSLNYDTLRVNLAGREVPGPSGPVTPFPAYVFELANVQTFSGSGSSYLHNTYNAALKWENALPPKYDLGFVFPDALPLPFGLIRRKNAGGCRLRRSAKLTVSANTNTAVPWTDEDWDPDGFHSTTSNTSRVTVPTGMAGKYEIEVGVSFAANATGRRSLVLRLNGATQSVARDNRSAAVAGDTPLYATTKLQLAAGDYLEAYVYHEAGADLDLDVPTLGSAAAWLVLTRVSD